MGRGPKPAKAKVEAKLPPARTSRKSKGSTIHDLEKRLTESLEREKATGRALTEALGQQTATAEMLRVISRSPTDIQPVLEAIAESVARLCNSPDVTMSRIDGGILQLAVHRGPISSLPAYGEERVSLDRGSVVGRSVIERRTIHLADLSSEDVEYPEASARARRFGYRTVVSAPLLKEDEAIGAIAMRRIEARPFTEQQVALLQTFADQVVIAIENVRLFTELQEKNKALTTAHAQMTETLEQQTATGEILRVISESPTDVQPVFEVIAAHACRLCDGVFANVIRFDGTLMHNMAENGFTEEAREFLRRAFPSPPSRSSMSGRAILAASVVYVEDVTHDMEPGVSREMGGRTGHRAMVSVPMLHNGAPVGAITVARLAAGRFAERQVNLLKTFADQAVIAIENVRLFNETKERLEQQTATAEILRVISQSQTDLQPVFEVIARSAAQLCEATFAALQRFDGQVVTFDAHYGMTEQEVDASRDRFPLPAERGTAVGRAILDRRTTHIQDIRRDPGYRISAGQTSFRTVLAVPLLRDGVPVGAIGLWRREVQPFSEKHIKLVETFADQAVIAIENVRLFAELQEKNQALTRAHAQVSEALDQQTATSEILRVISSSPTDVQPVFDTIVQTAARLCHAANAGVFLTDGRTLDLPANYGSSSPEALAIARAQYPRPLDQETTAGVAILTRSVVHVPDIEAPSPADVYTRRVGRLLGVRSMVAVPMLRTGEVVGAINLSRREPGRFSDAEVELLKTFADQAVIAIENVRLFKELEAKNRALTQAHTQVTEALDQQTATSAILRVIASSPTDLQPVLDATAESAARLCAAYDANIFRLDGDVLRLVAHHGPLTLPPGFVVSATRGTITGRAVLDRQTVQVADLQAEAEEFPESSSIAQQFGYRTILSVPLLREGAAIGAIALRRTEVQPFTNQQIALLKTFADQAVIAIENVRLFKELEARNRDLTTALDRQTATSEILRVISQSPTDVQPVFDTILTNAKRLLRGLVASVSMRVGDELHLAAFTSMGRSLDATVVQAFPISIDSPGPHPEVVRRGEPHVITDAEAQVDVPESVREIAHTRGWRSNLAVPLRRGGSAIGTLSVARRDPGTFTPTEVALLQTFADQAVIAIENMRLFKELEARTGDLTRSVEKLTALGEVSRSVSSTLDVETVLDTIVSRATQLAGADGCSIYEYDDAAEVFHVRATHGIDAALVGTLRAMPLRKGEGVMGRAAETREAIQIADIAVPDAYQSHLRDVLIGAGFRALLSVPLLREEQIIGSLSLNRKAPGEFSPEVVEVLKTFATQSALAIQNARLFREIEAKSRQLEVASQHKSEFLANMSHELRTPLNAIIGFSEVLGERMFGELNEKQDEYLKDIYASGQHLLSLINDILDLSKVEAGRMELELTDFNLPATLDNALTLVRERAGRHGIALHMSVDERLDQVRADERKIRQVVLNVLSNAIKFTPEGGSINIRAMPGDRVVEVSVSDTGVGIAPEDQEAIFEEFRQVGTAAKKVEGTGLGLALSRKFIELHGGRIWVQSKVGAGSTFTFSIPMRT